MSFQKLVFLLAACGSAGPVLAQRTAIAPLAPVAASVTVPPLGVDVSSLLHVRPVVIVLDQPARVVRPQPIFLLNSHIVIGSGLAQLNPQDIVEIQVYKGVDAPAKWRGLTANGIIAITLRPQAKPKLKTTSLAAIGRGLRLRGPVSYQLDGLPLEDLTLRIATADIARCDTQPTTGGTVVNIRLAVPPPVAHPPGTILIRGAAGS